jgi:polar amino acid transport system substrate-binding protein
MAQYRQNAYLKSMKRYGVGFALALFLLASPGWTAPKPGSVLHFATEGAAPPFNYFEKSELKGFEIDLANAIASELKVSADWKAYPFDSLLIGLNEHKYDLVAASHSITPERAKAVDFTKPHYCSGGVIVSRNGGPLTAAELRGKKVAVQVGTTYLAKAREIPGIVDIKTYPTDPAAQQSLLAGRVDAWITDRFFALEGLRKQPGKMRIGELVFSDRIGMAVAKGNQDLLAAINSALDHVQADGTYERISKHYFGEDIRCK